MMSLTDLINKYKGQPCEMGGSSGAVNQCVDLANAWLFEGLEQPKVLGTNAIDFPEKIGDKWEWIANSSYDLIPSEGDLVIFNIGDYGHISIFVEGDSLSFKSFDQNYPLGSLCHIQSHKYSKVIGWLHFKGLQKNMTDDQKRALDILTKFQIEAKHGNLEGAANAAVGAVKDLANCRVEITGLNGKIEELTKSCLTWQSDLFTAKQNLSAIKTMLNDYGQLFSLAIVKFNKKDLEEYLNTEISKIINSQIL